MRRGNSEPGHPPGRSVRVSTDLVIETPENVVLTYRLAGPAARLLAYLIDFVVRAALLIALYILAVMGTAAGLAGISIGMFLLMIFFIDWAYYGISEGFFRGKTIGKFIFGLRVIQEEGYPVTLWGALLRNIVRAGDSLPFYLFFPCYGAGFVTMLAAGKFRRLGDLVARTLVIEERRVSVPREPIILEKIEALPRTELGGFVPAGQTLALIEQFLGRRHVLTYRRGHAMAHVLARALAKKLAYSGDPQLVERYPMAFLARVYATFYRVREEADLQVDVEDVSSRGAGGENRARPALAGAAQ
ncbi:MAG TPA: RDD family protein [Planctomycetaceae bacterium]